MGNDNPGVLLRAAGLFEALGDGAAAAAAYERTITLTAGSPSPGRAVALNNLAFALVAGARGSPAPATLDRAKALADEAVAVDPQTDYFETLGYIESLRKDRDRAISAYRRAIQSASPARPPAAMAGLASLLAEGDNRQRTEAAELIKVFETQPALATQLSPLRKAALEQARRTLGLPPR
jgi:tetratricopeptide (TPR) repeat protein